MKINLPVTQVEKPWSETAGEGHFLVFRTDLKGIITSDGTELDDAGELF